MRYGHTRLYEAFGLCFLNHVEANPIFHTPAWLLRLQLACNASLDALGHLRC